MRALLIDDHLMFSQSLRFLLEDLDPTLSCESAASIADAVARPGPFDLILLDYRLPDSDGTTGLTRVLQAHEEASVVMLSGEEDPALVLALVDAGAAGFVPKSADMDTLLTALRTMLAGGVYLPAFALANGPCLSRQPTPPQGWAQPTLGSVVPRGTGFADSGFADHLPCTDGAIILPPRQLECLLRLVQGKPNKAIARELHLADSTVKSHLSAAFRALGVTNRTEAVFKAARLGLLPPHPDAMDADADADSDTNTHPQPNAA